MCLQHLALCGWSAAGGVVDQYAMQDVLVSTSCTLTLSRACPKAQCRQHDLSHGQRQSSHYSVLAKRYGSPISRGSFRWSPEWHV